MERKEKNIKCVVVGSFVVSLLAVIFYVFNFTELYFNSDAAATVLLAKEQIEKGQLIPDGFCYSTGVFVISLANFIVPFMLFIKDWLLCRELAVLVLIILFFTLLFVFYRKIGVKSKITYAPFLAVTMFCLPMGHYRQTFYEAAYVLSMVGELIILLLFFKLIESEKRWYKDLPYYIGLVATGILWNSGDIRNQVIIMLPAIVSVILYAVVEHLCKKEIKLNVKKTVASIMLVAISAGLGYFIYSVLMQKVELNDATAQIVFSSGINENLYKFPEIVLEFYNAIANCGLITSNGILICLNFVVFAIATFVVPILSLVLYRKIENKFLKIYIIFIWISNFIVIYMMLFTNMTNVGRGYYQTVFFHHLVLMSLLIEYLLTHKSRIIKYSMLACVCGLVLFSHLTYFRGNRAEKQRYEVNNNYSLTQFLKDNKLTYGYATFWNAHKNTVLSNGEIIVAGVYPEGNVPYYWLTSREWYDTKAYNGRCFYLLGENENLDNRLVEAAEEIKHYKGYTILIYEQNFLEYEYDEVAKQLEQVSLKSLEMDDEAYFNMEKVYVRPDGSFKSVLPQLSAGKYEIMLSGTNVDSILIESTKEYETTIESDDKQIIQFTISDEEELTFVYQNESDDLVIIDRFCIMFKEKIND